MDMYADKVIILNSDVLIKLHILFTKQITNMKQQITDVYTVLR